MTKWSLKRKWLKTKISLHQTVQKILDINRRRKELSSQQVRDHEEKLQEELKVLNRLADTQARLLRKYEDEITMTADHA